MPKTAAVVASFGERTLPETMKMEQLESAIHALSQDLPGDPIAYIERSAPQSDQCECGAIHLSVSDPLLDASTAGSLHRVLATPYGDILREYFKRRHGYATIRFGWSGIDARVPRFVEAVRVHDVQRLKGSGLSNVALHAVIDAVRIDVPRVMEMVDGSIELSRGRNDRTLRSYAVSPTPGADGRTEWQELISQVMFVWSTPVRKYLDEYLLREHEMVGGAINCCIIATMRADGPSWRQQWFDEQTGQQLTPDC
jgi:hypothetical protein